MVKIVASNQKNKMASKDDNEEDDSDKPVEKPINDDIVKAFQTICYSLQCLENVPETTFFLSDGWCWF